MSCVWTFALRSIVSRARRELASSRRPARSRWTQPTIAFRGVRSSCESVARNSSFIRLAASACARACSATASSRARSASATFRSVMSRLVTTKPANSPLDRWRGAPAMSIQRYSPSCRRTRASSSKGRRDWKPTRCASSVRTRSSGWITSTHPCPVSSCRWRPVNSAVRWFRKLTSPSTPDIEISTGAWSATARKRLSLSSAAARRCSARSSCVATRASSSGPENGLIR